MDNLGEKVEAISANNSVLNTQLNLIGKNTEQTSFNFDHLAYKAPKLVIDKYHLKDKFYG